jgi:hypothetical protein
MRKLIILSIFILVFSLTVYSSPKNKLRDLYEITEEKVYMVRIKIPTMEDIEKLKDLGIVCKSPGKLSTKVTEDKFEELKEEGFEVDIVKKAIEVQGKRKSSPVPKLREQHEESDYNPFDYDIPEDESGYNWVSSPIDIYGAPYGALVTSVDVYYEIIHPYTGELIVNLSDEDTDVEYNLWLLQGGNQNNIYESEEGIQDFNGEPVNQTWSLDALDFYENDNEGYITYWEITVYYGDPDLVITDLDVSNTQPWEDGYIDVYLTIRNQGDGYADDFATAIFFNEESQPSAPVTGDYHIYPSLAPGESRNYTIYSITTGMPGMWHMYGLIDNWNDIEESNEYNNGYGPVNVFWKERPQDDFYEWPVKNPDFDDQSPLSGTFMEFRTGNRFHDAIDVCGTEGKATYNVSAGEITNRLVDPEVGQTRIGNFNYIHLVNMPSYTMNTWVNSDTLIGYTNYLDHVHLSDGADGSEVNPLRAYGITPYEDTEEPEILDVTLVRDGTLYETIDPNNVNGRVDIIAHARDDISMQCTPGPKAVYRIGYQILTVHSQPIYNIQFDNWLPSSYIDYVYAIDDNNLTTMSEHYYIVTNNMTSNNYLDAADLPVGDYTLRITAQDIRTNLGGIMLYNTSDPYDIDITVIPTGVDENKEIPKTFAIHQNFPNPFSERTEIKYQLPEECDVELAIYNIIGGRVKTLIDKKQSPGYYSTCWSGKDSRGRNVPAGTYFLTCKAGDFNDSKKIVKLTR